MTTDTHVTDIIGMPAALVDLPRMRHNTIRAQYRMNTLGVKFRPHVKTTKCLGVVRAQMAVDAQSTTVSTLKEVETFSAVGIKDILYAVGTVIIRLLHAMALRKWGYDPKFMVDNAEATHAVVDCARVHGERREAWIEVDTDGRRSGITPEQDTLLEIGRILRSRGIDVSGMMTRAGSSYNLNDRAVLATLAEQERVDYMCAAQYLRETGVPCITVSMGSTPTALAIEHLESATEVRADVYVFFDLAVHNAGVRAMDGIIPSVLTTVVGHRPDEGRMIVGAGQMVMSRDRGTTKQSHDFGYGQSYTLDGVPLEGPTLIGASQKHGILAVNDGSAHAGPLARLPVDAKLCVLPDHACTTGAQLPEHQVVPSRSVVQTWTWFHGR